MKKSKAPLFDHAKMAADADVDHAHAVRRAAPAVHDRAVRQEGRGVPVRRPGAARRRYVKPTPAEDDVDDRPTQAAAEGGDARAVLGRRAAMQPTSAAAAAGAAGPRASAPAPPRPRRRAPGRCTSSTTWRPRSVTLHRRRLQGAAARPRWASFSPDGKTVDLRAQPQPLHDGRRQATRRRRRRPTTRPSSRCS